MLLEAAKGERLEALFVLAVTTGMRQGELFALSWNDVDLDSASLTIRATLQRMRGQGFVFLLPKTKKSRRKITLSARAVEALRRHDVGLALELASKRVSGNKSSLRLHSPGCFYYRFVREPAGDSNPRPAVYETLG